MNQLSFSIFALFLLFLAGCGRYQAGNTTVKNKNQAGEPRVVCTMQAIAGLAIMVSKTTWAQGQSPNGLRVTVRDGSYLEEFSIDEMIFDQSTGAVGVGAAYERTGNYTVTVSFPGESVQSAQASVSLDSSGCHVVTRRVTFQLP